MNMKEENIKKRTYRDFYFYCSSLNQLELKLMVIAMDYKENSESGKLIKRIYGELQKMRNDFLKEVSEARKP